MKMGLRSAVKGDYTASIEYYIDALNGGSDNAALLYNNLADSYMNAGQLGLAMEQAKNAIDDARDKTLPYVTLAEISQAKGQHEKGVEYIHRALKILEKAMPEMKDALFDTIEEVIKKLPTREKFELASKDWVRLIYLVKYTAATFQMERDLIKKHGGTWKGLLKGKKLALETIGAKYLSSKERLGIKSDDAAAIAKTYGAMSAIIGSPKVTITEKGAEQSSIRVSGCWQYSVIRSMGLDRDPGWVSCSLYCKEYINNVARAINPEAHFEFDSALSEGSKYCEGSFTIQ
jgi:tetratricopeptide (TPR) repeat protein